MGELLIILETLSIEQYKMFFNNKPIFTPAIKNKKSEYIEMLSSGNEILKQLLNKMIDSNITIVNSTFNEGKTNIEFMISKNDLKLIKYIKEHFNSNDLNLKISLNNECYVINMEIHDIKKMLIFKQIIENYLILNPLSNVSNEDVSKYILKAYQPLNKDYLAYLKEVNKNEIIYIKEKYRQKNFQFDDHDFIEIEDPLQNSISIFEIYSKDHKFKCNPYNELTEEMKYVMCNKYFEKLFKERLKILKQSLIEQYKIIFNVNFNKQYQSNLGNYGITGNLQPFDHETPNIEIFLYGDLNFCKIEEEKAIFNEDLFGQVCISILHEHQHILQRLGLINENLKNAISVFELKSNENSNFYVENYNNDPAELDANLTSFMKFNNISPKLGVTNPDNIIMKKVKNNILNADETFNFYNHTTITNINDVYSVLNDSLDESIINYSNYGSKKL